MAYLADAIFQRTGMKDRVTSHFGKRTDPVTKQPGVQHNGTDYSTGGAAWPQHAVAAGVIEDANQNEKKDARGRYVIVKYPALGIRVQHYHLATVSAKTGQSATPNMALDTTGTSGRSTAVHAHIGVQRLSDGAYLDPEKYAYTPPAGAGTSVGSTGTPPAKQAVIEPRRASQEAPKKTAYKVGETVILDGPVFVDSYGTGQGRTFANHRATVTIAVDPARAAPYHVGQIGWARAKDLKKA